MRLAGGHRIQLAGSVDGCQLWRHDIDSLEVNSGVEFKYRYGKRRCATMRVKQKDIGISACGPR